MTTNVHLTKKDPIPPLVKVREVAKLLSVSPATVRALMQCGDLEAKPINPTVIRIKRKVRRKITDHRQGPRVHMRVTRTSLLEFYFKRFKRPLTQALANPFDEET